MPATYLRITVTPHREGSLPGYDGDRRVEWSIAEDAGSVGEAQRRTRDALRVLRAFWEDGAPRGLRFGEFAKTVLDEGGAGGSEQHGPTQSEKPQQEQPSAQRARKRRNKHADLSDDEDEEDEDELNASETNPAQSADVQEMDLVDPLSEKLVRHPNVLPAFLSDLRDWDSFRLLLRRHGGHVPTVAPRPSSQSDDLKAPAANGVNPPRPSTDVQTWQTDSQGQQQQHLDQQHQYEQKQNATTIMLATTLATRERQWQEERASLHAALWASGDQIRTLVGTLTDRLSSLNPSPTSELIPPPRSKSVRWDELVLKREVIKESSAQWSLPLSDADALDWRQAEWLRELAKQEEVLRQQHEQGQQVENAGGRSDHMGFSTQDILALVRAGRSGPGRVGEEESVESWRRHHPHDIEEENEMNFHDEEEAEDRLYLSDEEDDLIIHPARKDRQPEHIGDDFSSVTSGTPSPRISPSSTVEDDSANMVGTSFHRSPSSSETSSSVQDDDTEVDSDVEDPPISPNTKDAEAEQIESAVAATNAPDSSEVIVDVVQPPIIVASTTQTASAPDVALAADSVNLAPPNLSSITTSSRDSPPYTSSSDSNSTRSASPTSPTSKESTPPVLIASGRRRRPRPLSATLDEAVVAITGSRSPTLKPNSAKDVKVLPSVITTRVASNLLMEATPPSTPPPGLAEGDGNSAPALGAPREVHSPLTAPVSKENVRIPAAADIEGQKEILPTPSASIAPEKEVVGESTTDDQTALKENVPVKAISTSTSTTPDALKITDIVPAETPTTQVREGVTTQTASEPVSISPAPIELQPSPTQPATNSVFAATQFSPLLPPVAPAVALSTAPAPVRKATMSSVGTMTTSEMGTNTSPMLGAQQAIVPQQYSTPQQQQQQQYSLNQNQQPMLDSPAQPFALPPAQLPPSSYEYVTAFRHASPQASLPSLSSSPTPTSSTSGGISPLILPHQSRAHSPSPLVQESYNIAAQAHHQSEVRRAKSGQQAIQMKISQQLRASSDVANRMASSPGKVSNSASGSDNPAAIPDTHVRRRVTMADGVMERHHEQKKAGGGLKRVWKKVSSEVMRRKSVK